ncbi:Outer membrane efflux protein [Vibrio mangrovi]|uniref:Outer membrane efflux protein n=1 Tax=Vibrio mangrovi TaxID=474394 RepID=A0A1Y6IMS1_9VIBR|nr:Outer membrane efflux protein [Vibrio mangrovi]
MNIKPCILALSVSAAAWMNSTVYADTISQNTVQSSTVTSLPQLIEIALNHDGNRKQFLAEAQAIRETGIADATWMDPKLKVGVTGLPVDSFEFDEDPMTNLSIGIMQQFGRGDTLDLRHRKANQQANGTELQAAARELDVINSMVLLWLELGYQQIAEKVLLENRQLMQEMEQFIQTNYSIGKSETQDLLNAQLQVSRLDEKLQTNKQRQQRLIAQLSEWLGSDWLATGRNLQASNHLDWSKLQQQLDNNTDLYSYYPYLNQHPMVRMTDATITARQTQVDIARQAYTPQFGIEVMYAYRQSNNMRGEPASDLVSAYLTMDIPLFTGNRQDRKLSAAQYQVGAAQSQKDVLLTQMNAKVNALLADHKNLNQRIQHYQSTLLPQAKARIHAVERGYQNNTAQFNDVITASNDELSLQLEHQRLLTDLNIVNSRLAQLLGSYEFPAAKPLSAITPVKQ